MRKPRVYKIPEEAFERGRHMPKHNSIPAALVQQRLHWVEGCLTLGMMDTQVFAQARKPPPEGIGCGLTATRAYLRRVRDRWLLEGEAARAYNKEEALHRLMHVRRRALQNGDLRTVLGYERLIADIQGTREPLRVDVNVNVNVALMQVIGSLTEEQRTDILAEYEELVEAKKVVDMLPAPPQHLNGNGQAH